ncbi:hypothetical protein E4U21_005886 [Claviceps maximensis]|nr:hypothetical protein E4U21_005886 [Claviceps maximensis]
MDCSVHKTYLRDWSRQSYRPRCPLNVLPLEIKRNIIPYLSLQDLARLNQCCQSWFILTDAELWRRDAKFRNSSAMNWAVAHAVDDETTRMALKILQKSAQFGGQVNAIQREFPDRMRGATFYQTSTILNRAVAMGNLRIATRLLEMGARHDMPCSGPRWVFCATRATWLRKRVDDFESFYGRRQEYGRWLPLLVAFINSDHKMGQLLIRWGASRDAVIVPHDLFTEFPISILHFAAANKAKDFEQWTFLFDTFAAHINENCTMNNAKQYTPLHVAMMVGNTQGMQLAVKTGANMEVQNPVTRSPLIESILRIPSLGQGTRKRKEHMDCIRKFVELGASVNTERDCVLVPAIGCCRGDLMSCSDVRALIDFFLDNGADVNGHTTSGTTPLQALIMAILIREDSPPPERKVLRKLVHDLVKRGMDLTLLTPGVSSPLYMVMLCRNAQPAWLFRLLCTEGATIHRAEVNDFFIHWCQQKRLWGQRGQGNYDVWQHAPIISTEAVEFAYTKAFASDNPSLYNTLTRQRLARPSNNKLVQLAYHSKKKWCWRKIVECGFAGAFILQNRKENMLHLTVRVYQNVPDYSAQNASRDITRLLKNGADITLQNVDGKDPLELFLALDSEKEDSLKLLAALDKAMNQAHDTQITQQLLDCVRRNSHQS